ncbi:hypothetical protein F01_410367 [Burkholderia cenocepacia]|nr:hypothetical protein F01_410367 [Burkholderia cenocepacia]
MRAVRVRIGQPRLGIRFAGQRLRRTLRVRPPARLVLERRTATRRDRAAARRRARRQRLGIAQGVATAATLESDAARMARLARRVSRRCALGAAAQIAGIGVLLAGTRASSLPRDGEEKFSRLSARRHGALQEVPVRTASAARGALDRHGARHAADALRRSRRRDRARADGARGARCAARAEDERERRRIRAAPAGDPRAGRDDARRCRTRSRIQAAVGRRGDARRVPARRGRRPMKSERRDACGDRAIFASALVRSMQASNDRARVRRVVATIAAHRGGILDAVRHSAPPHAPQPSTCPAC